MNVFDTIAAVSSPQGKGGVALLRVSGSDALAICEKVFVPKNKKRLSELDSNHMVYGDIYAVDGDGERIDDGMAVVFRAPRSFTGEDTVEITCHGGLLVTKEVLTALLAAGARAAEAGEFTRRAFAAGKMGLSAAEALGSLLEAKTHAALKLSRSGLDGRLEKKTGELFSELLSVASALYAAVDYPEEDLAELPRGTAREKAADVLERVRTLADTYKSGHAVAEGVRTVICGKPNVGKSSLFNALIGKDAAIVTDVAGTTRDVLEQVAVLGKVTLRLYDTAGLHESGDTVESIGIERAKAVLGDAEFILAVFDASAPLAEEDRELCRMLETLPVTKFALLNKSDRTSKLTEEDFCGFDRVISLSAKEGTGLPLLAEAVESAFFDGELSLTEDAIVANARQHAALLRCISALESTVEAFDLGLAEDICCSGLEEALAALGDVDGREVSEQIVGEIFSKFCVGK